MNSEKSLRVSAIRRHCDGHGLCFVIDETLFPIDDEGYIDLPEEGVRVPAGMEALAREGVDACPARALQIVED